ncbi:MAG: porin [Planctomycetota bacterium]
MSSRNSFGARCRGVVIASAAGLCVGAGGYVSAQSDGGGSSSVVRTSLLGAVSGTAFGAAEKKQPERDPWGREWLLLSAVPSTVPGTKAGTLNIGGMLQGQYISSIREQDAARSVDDFESGFQIRRSRIKLSGDLGVASDGAKLPFVLQTQATQGGGVQMIDAFVGWQRGDWTISAGRFIVPFAREGLTSVTTRLAVDFSPATAFFSFGGPLFRASGVEARYIADEWSFATMVHDGNGGGFASFQNDETDIGWMTRIEKRFGGTWDQFRDATSPMGSDSSLLLGGAANISVGEGDGNMDGLQREAFTEIRWTADATFEGDGWTVYGAAYGLHRDDQGLDNTNIFGANAHAGVYVDQDLELYSQYSWITDEDTAGQLSILFVGANKYLAGHSLKLQGDVGYAIESVPTQFANPSLGILPDAAGERGQVIVRGQVQLVF